MEILISLGLKLLPYLALLGAVLWGYTRIKSKGATEERAKWEEAKREVEANVRDAESKDAEVDRGVNEHLDQIKSKEVAGGGNNRPADPDIFKF